MENDGTFVPEIDLSLGSEQELADQLYRSLTTVGFACLKTTELWKEADEYMEKARKFFTLPTETKASYLRPNDSNFGWVGKGRESLNPERPGDHKECFNLMFPQIVTEGAVPAELYSEEALQLWKTFTTVANKVGRLICIALKLKDAEYLNSVSHYDNSDINPSAMRINYYPPLLNADNPAEFDIKLLENQVRCGEHSDYGSITLLYTQSPGLEVLNRSTGEYMAAGQNRGAIYVNIGDLLQMWTDDVLIANKHRVMIPTAKEHLQSDRFSIAFFCHPDDDTSIQSLLSSQKYPPVSAGDWLKSRFDATYHRI